MSRVFFHSDWHFNHDFVAKTRDFDSAEEHDEWLIDNINKSVTKRDQLWVLGDIGMGSLTTVLEKVSRLNGQKHLIFGNHCPGHPMHKRSHTKQKQYMEVFDSIGIADQHTIKGNKVMLSHFPFRGDHYDKDRYEQWRLRDEGLPLICGHVHHLWKQQGRQFNVGVDHYPQPVSADELAKIIWP